MTRWFRKNVLVWYVLKECLVLCYILSCIEDWSILFTFVNIIDMANSIQIKFLYDFEMRLQYLFVIEFQEQMWILKWIISTYAIMTSNFQYTASLTTNSSLLNSKQNTGISCFLLTPHRHVSVTAVDNILYRIKESRVSGDKPNSLFDNFESISKCWKSYIPILRMLIWYLAKLNWLNE